MSRFLYRLGGGAAAHLVRRSPPGSWSQQRPSRSRLPSAGPRTTTTTSPARLPRRHADRAHLLVIGFVVAVSVLLLAMVFRSAVVPLKAALMNLLSIGAAYGVVTAAVQWGWGSRLIGLDHATPVSSWLPILMFAILFGLSMDYGDVVVKMLGFGMAVAILLDATVIRMVLVPATMALLGRWNWWLPAWLDRLLPRIEADVAGLSWDDRPVAYAGAPVDDEYDDRTPVAAGRP